MRRIFEIDSNVNPFETFEMDPNPFHVEHPKSNLPPTTMITYAFFSITIPN